jgi:hypothetical protein
VWLTLRAPLMARVVPEHDAAPSGPVRRVVVRVLAAAGVWHLLPGRAQGALCNCPVDRGRQ